MAAQLLASDKKLAEMHETSTVSIPSSTISAVSHEEMPKDPTWHAMQVALSERLPLYRRARGLVALQWTARARSQP